MLESILRWMTKQDYFKGSVQNTVEPSLTATSPERQPLYNGGPSIHSLFSILTSLQQPPLHNGNGT